MKVAAISPSWLIKRHELRKGIETLKKLGFDVTNKKTVSKLPTPRQKAREIHRAFADKKIGLILARRGGFSSMKVLPHINFELIRKNPKLFAGFSDLSALLNSIYERTGLVTLHSPMVLNFENPARFTVNSFMNAVGGFPERNLFRETPVTVYKHGVSSGTLKGGNLITLTALIGTSWEINSDNAIIFFEDVDEKLHQIDRYLTQWILAGKLKKVKGVVLGDFRGVKNSEVYKILSTQMKIDFPVVHCPYIGHVAKKITLPVGAKVRLDTRKKTLRILA